MNFSRISPSVHRGLMLLAPLSAALLVACASTPPENALLNQARQVYSRASTDADTARSAPIDLRASQQALQQAEAAFKEGEIATTEHYAYLARQRAEAALQSGEVARAEKAVAAAGEERNRILISARTQDADQARARAERERMQAEQARSQAEQAAQRAQHDRQLAEQQRAEARAAQDKVAKLQADLAALQAQQTDRGMVLTLGDVLFDTGRAQLKPGAYDTLDRLATFMRDNPERMIKIEGHTDSVGSEASNMALSQQRAESVRTALVQRGVSGSRISSAGLGESTPVASNDTPEGRQRNRRVEIVIDNPR